MTKPLAALLKEALEFDGQRSMDASTERGRIFHEQMIWLDGAKDEAARRTRIDAALVECVEALEIIATYVPDSINKSELERETELAAQRILMKLRAVLEGGEK